MNEQLDELIAPTEAASVSAAAKFAGKIDENDDLPANADDNAERGRFGEKGKVPVDPVTLDDKYGDALRSDAPIPAAAAAAAAAAAVEHLVTSRSSDDDVGKQLPDDDVDDECGISLPLSVCLTTVVDDADDVAFCTSQNLLCLESDVTVENA